MDSKVSNNLTPSDYTPILKENSGSNGSNKARTAAAVVFGLLATGAAGFAFTLALRPGAVGITNLDTSVKILSGVGGGLLLGGTGVGEYIYFRSPLLERLEKQLRELRELQSTLSEQESQASTAHDNYKSEVEGYTEKEKTRLFDAHKKIKADLEAVTQKLQKLEGEHLAETQRLEKVELEKSKKTEEQQ